MTRFDIHKVHEDVSNYLRKQRIKDEIWREMGFRIWMNHWKAACNLSARYKRVNNLPK